VLRPVPKRVPQLVLLLLVLQLVKTLRELMVVVVVAVAVAVAVVDIWLDQNQQDQRGDLNRHRWWLQHPNKRFLTH